MSPYTTIQDQYEAQRDTLRRLNQVLDELEAQRDTLRRLNQVPDELEAQRAILVRTETRLCKLATHLGAEDFVTRPAHHKAY